MDWNDITNDGVKADIDKLTKIIKKNPGSTLMVDNDHWYFIKAKPDSFAIWNEEDQEKWWEDSSELCESRDFPTLDSSNGWGVLEVLCFMANVKLGSARGFVFYGEC